MYYVYLLQSQKTSKYYVGFSSNLKRRLQSHNSGNSKVTKPDLPWRLVYYEAYSTEQAARLRERKLKHHGKGLAELKLRLLG